jgi:hypothetical protein
LTAHVPGVMPPAFSRSAFSWSDSDGRLRAGEHVGIVGTTIVTMNELPLAGGAVCDFQSRAESDMERPCQVRLFSPLSSSPALMSRPASRPPSTAGPRRRPGITIVIRPIRCPPSKAASVVAEAAVATVDHSDIRGSEPHNRDPSGAASDYQRGSSPEARRIDSVEDSPFRVPLDHHRCCLHL